MAGVYIHIPFCKKACHYCNFHFSTQKNYKTLVYAIIKEIEINQKKFNNKNISTIYFGGGTPSIIENELIKKIIIKINNNYKVSKDCEITLEVNPDDVTTKKLNSWKKIGINRLSLGVQTFNDNLLKQLNRIHTSKDAIKSINKIKNTFNNYSIDLMFGTPNSSGDSIKYDLSILKELSPPHVSIYNMTLEKRTVFYNLLKKKKISLPSESSVLDQYDLILNELEIFGYENYEISNFAKKNFHSQHNSNYWNNKEYIGFGPSAHSYDKTFRYWNISDNKKYIELIDKEKKVYEKEELSRTEKINEYILTRIRTKKGVNQNELLESFNVNLLKEREKELKLFKKEKLVKIEKNIISLTNEGKKLCDYITEKITY